jgi:hypothetical protein
MNFRGTKKKAKSGLVKIIPNDRSDCHMSILENTLSSSLIRKEMLEF